MNTPLSQTIIERGVAEIIDRGHLASRLTAGDTLRVKLGIDPSKPDLHIGHAVTLRKLRQFQDAGHTAILIIGDTTAQIGDPTDRSEARKMLSEAEVKQNAEGFLDQAYRIIDDTKVEVHYHSEWFNKFSLRNIFELLASTTINHLLSHETFAARLNNNQPLYSHEILYPLLQGYDSVMVKSDVEIGGIDQKFNILMGRVLQRAHNQPEQDVILLQYVPGTDGQAKMSKTSGNTINLTDSPLDMFGKVMSIPDSLIMPYFEMITELPASEMKAWQEALTSHSVNPKEVKLKLARQIVSEFHSSQAASQAEAGFERVFRDKQTPSDMETIRLAPGNHNVSEVLVDRTTLVPSKNAFRRLIEQRGIKINQTVLSDANAQISPTDGEEIIIQIGPRRWLKVLWKT